MPARHLIHVLIVDDNSVCAGMLARLLQFKLRHLSDFKITTASSAEEALQNLENTAYDIIFSDIEMGVMSGTAMAKEIRRRNIDIPIIAVTSRYDSKSCNEYREAGFTKWLEKPAKFQDIYTVIEEMLKGKSMTSLTSWFELLPIQLQIIPSWPLFLPIKFSILLGISEFMKGKGGMIGLWQ